MIFARRKCATGTCSRFHSKLQAESRLANFFPLWEIIETLKNGDECGNAPMRSLYAPLILTGIRIGFYLFISCLKAPGFVDTQVLLLVERQTVRSGYKHKLRVIPLYSPLDLTKQQFTEDLHSLQAKKPKIHN